jgi:glutathione S-transferase
MMILRSSPPSPFGRKVKIALALLGLEDRAEIVKADTNNPDDAIRTHNPLGKIPALTLPDGRTLYDSRVILDYLDHLAGGGIIIPAGPARFDALLLQAEADGLLDAALLQVYEARFREPDKHDANWLLNQAGKVERVLAKWEQAPPDLPATPHVGTIAAACALGYLDLRFAGRWRQSHPRLVEFLDAFALRVPSFEATKVVP